MWQILNKTWAEATMPEREFGIGVLVMCFGIGVIIRGLWICQDSMVAAGLLDVCGGGMLAVFGAWRATSWDE